MLQFESWTATFAAMEQTHHDHQATPPDCFRLEELEVLQSFEGKTFIDVNCYLWLNQGTDETLPYRFIYYVELIFDDNSVLLFTSGEDSEAIRLGKVEELVATAEALRKLHGVISIQRVHAGSFPLWLPVQDQSLEAIRLSKQTEGFYLNDALLLDFGVHQVLLRLSEKEGLELIPYI